MRPGSLRRYGRGRQPLLRSTQGLQGSTGPTEGEGAAVTESLFKGLPRIDATEPLTISIHKTHVRYGAERHPDRCAVALAARARADVIEAYIGARSCYVRFRSDPDTWVRYRLTQRGVNMVRYFDSEPDAVQAAAAWMDVQSVELKPPSPSRRLGVMHSQKRTGVRPGNTVIDRRPSLRNVMVRDD